MKILLADANLRFLLNSVPHYNSNIEISTKNCIDTGLVKEEILKVVQNVKLSMSLLAKLNSQSLVFFIVVLSVTLSV